MLFFFIQPFWPTGSGCARGVLSALDAAWMVRSFAQDKPPLQILSERENIYRLLSGTSTENMHKNHVLYTINPSSRYTHVPQKKIQEVYHLYDTDDPVNADFSLGSPTGLVTTKGTVDFFIIQLSMNSPLLRFITPSTTRYRKYGLKMFCIESHALPKYDILASYT